MFLQDSCAWLASGGLLRNKTRILEFFAQVSSLKSWENIAKIQRNFYWWTNSPFLEQIQFLPESSLQKLDPFHLDQVDKFILTRTKFVQIQNIQPWVLPVLLWTRSKINFPLFTKKAKVPACFEKMNYLNTQKNISRARKKCTSQSRLTRQAQWFQREFCLVKGKPWPGEKLMNFTEFMYSPSFVLHFKLHFILSLDVAFNTNTGNEQILG